MASRGGGRGRGRGQLTFNMEAVGIGKGEALPPPTLQPSPLFPPLEFHPVPLPAGEEGEYVLALKQELRGAMRQLPYFIRPAVPKRDVERYSDKYQMSGPIDNAIDWNPDWRRLPRELKIRVRKLQKEPGTTIILPKRPPKTTEDKEETIQRLEETDYIMSYFDNGEDFGGDSDDNMDEAIY
ncbi:DNA-directed RNA polymerase III subunit RPC7-like isoform X2 [Onychomys torridus]|uniref:DNA-directed RNA polymerase III subunit RPC7-like isoform X2 n=1 Tax=Onychomys torridus TaxID=38674 RepID=UPI00167F60A3|nr:DNA-directed RNA polymerase III subunit RPC7-like isoform X2 [Onychomys torridus]